jgi:hypothetical protein
MQEKLIEHKFVGDWSNLICENCKCPFTRARLFSSCPDWGWDPNLMCRIGPGEQGRTHIWMGGGK